MTTSTLSSKVPPVHSKEEIYRYIDLGLGRGVDGTDPAPWLNKTSFQVRRVTFDNILGTDEGSSLQSYEREISSVRSQQIKIKASIAVPKSPVTIGADAEISRSVHSSRHSVGRKVINRTISFRDNFDDVPFGEEVCLTASPEKSQNFLTFEERLAAWILEHLKLKWEQEEETVALDLSSKCEYPLRDLSHVIEKRRTSDLKLIASACKEFVGYFRITHYVSSIQLGAAEYKVMTQKEYNTAMSMGGKLGVENVGGAEMQQKYTSNKKHVASELKRIGSIEKDNKVSRGSYEEAVVDVSIRPITTLIKTGFTNACMQKALTEYVETQSDKSDGPFYICCGVGPNLYLTVSPFNNAVLATRDISLASEFNIIPNDDQGGTNEFYIIFNKPNEDLCHTDVLARKYSVLESSASCSTKSIGLYLHAPVSICGDNPGPLFVCDIVTQKTSRFALNDRVVSDKGLNPVSLESWTNGSEMYYINCSRRPFRRDGYVAIKKIDDVTRERYVTVCVSNTHSHDNENIWMLFRLLSRQPEEDKSTDDPSQVHQILPSTGLPARRVSSSSSEEDSSKVEIELQQM